MMTWSRPARHAEFFSTPAGKIHGTAFPACQIGQFDQKCAIKKSVSIYEAKTQLSTLLRNVEDGSVITITRHGKAVAELRMIEEKPRPKAGSLKSPNFYMADDFDAPLPEFADYMPTADEGATLRVAEDAPPKRAKGKRE